MSEDLPNGKVFLERRFWVLMQFRRYAVQVGGLVINQGLEMLVQLVRGARVVCVAHSYA